MKTQFVILSILLATIAARAGELRVVRGHASGAQAESVQVQINDAKDDAILQLPYEHFKRVTKWKKSIYVEPRFQTRFVSVEATFEDVSRSR